MKTLNEQRCTNHSSREAVARCPQCRRFFCRECVTEHEGRMLCSACLAKITGSGRKTEHQWPNRVSLAVQGGFGFLLLWATFYLIGQLLLIIPHAFHEGTIWQTPWWRSP